MIDPKTLRGNYILFRYIVHEGVPTIELKDRNGKFWYCQLQGERFRIINVTAKSLFDELGENPFDPP